MSDFNDYSIGFMNEFRNVFGLSMLIWKIKEKQFKNLFLNYILVNQDDTIELLIMIFEIK